MSSELKGVPEVDGQIAAIVSMLAAVMFTSDAEKLATWSQHCHRSWSQGAGGGVVRRSYSILAWL